MDGVVYSCSRCITHQAPCALRARRPTVARAIVVLWCFSEFVISSLKALRSSGVGLCPPPYRTDPVFCFGGIFFFKVLSESEGHVEPTFFFRVLSFKTFERQRVSKQVSFQTQVRSPDVRNQKPRTQSGLCTWAAICCLPGCTLARKLDWKRSRCGHPWFNLIMVSQRPSCSDCKFLVCFWHYFWAELK